MSIQKPILAWFDKMDREGLNKINIQMTLGEIAKTLRVPFRIFINVSKDLNHHRLTIDSDMLEKIKLFFENTIKDADKPVDIRGLKKLRHISKEVKRKRSKVVGSSPLKAISKKIIFTPNGGQKRNT
jgi:hypothetical protein